jgi:biopolymer transport protein ExbD
MSMFIAIIPMLLLSAVFLELAAVKMNLPSGDPNALEEAKVEDSLDLRVYILDGAFAIEAQGSPRQVVKRVGDGIEGDLSLLLKQIAAAHPENRDVVIGSAATTRYQDLIHVMDVARGAGLTQASLLGTESR